MRRSFAPGQKVPYDTGDIDKRWSLARIALCPLVLAQLLFFECFLGVGQNNHAQLTKNTLGLFQDALCTQ